MLKCSAYSIKGIKKQPVNLPKKFDAEKNLKLLAQAIRVYEDRQHPGLSKTKTRSEISLTTKKWYRQKGTGGARHGAKSAPIFVGGSKAHGPKGVKRVLSLSKKMRAKALAVAMSIKAGEDKILIVDGFSTLKKTKDASNLISKLIKAEKLVTDKSRFTFALSEKNKSATLALRNIRDVKITPFKDLNAYKVYLGGIIVVDKDAIAEGEKKTNATRTKKSTKKGTSK